MKTCVLDIRVGGAKGERNFPNALIIFSGAVRFAEYDRSYNTIFALTRTFVAASIAEI